jgi:hypothetical protein
MCTAGQAVEYHEARVQSAGKILRQLQEDFCTALATDHTQALEAQPEGDDSDHVLAAPSDGSGRDQDTGSGDDLDGQWQPTGAGRAAACGDREYAWAPGTLHQEGLASGRAPAVAAPREGPPTATKHRDGSAWPGLPVPSPITPNAGKWFALEPLGGDHSHAAAMPMMGPDSEVAVGLALGDECPPGALTTAAAAAAAVGVVVGLGRHQGPRAGSSQGLKRSAADMSSS